MTINYPPPNTDPDLEVWLEVVRRLLNNYIYIPVVAGVPTGTPEPIAGRSAMCYDETNQRFYVYDNPTGAWRYATTV